MENLFNLGVGKSLTVNTIYQLMTNFYDKVASDACDKESVKVLLTAPTGVAAFLIGMIIKLKFQVIFLTNFKLI